MATTPPSDDRSSAPDPASLTHLDDAGRARMVEVSAKPETARRACASGRVILKRDTLRRIVSGDLPKGEVLPCARIAAIQAVKRTAELIPLCHPLRITGVTVHFDTGAVTTAGDNDESDALTSLGISVEVRAQDRTGVEMEALTAVSVCALTIYDMCKAVDREMVISEIRLDEKSGGRSGDFRRETSTSSR